MQIEFTGRRTGIPARLRALADRRLRKLARSLRGITHAHVVLTRKREAAHPALAPRRA